MLQAFLNLHWVRDIIKKFGRNKPLWPAPGTEDTNVFPGPSAERVANGFLTDTQYRQIVRAVREGSTPIWRA